MVKPIKESLCNKPLTKVKDILPSSVYTRRLNITIHDITRHRRLFNYIRMYYRRHYSTFNFSPEVYTILNSLPSLCFVPSFFMSYTLCRIGELHQITIPVIKSLQPYEISSSKSSHKRQILPFLPYKKKVLQIIDNNTLLMPVSYDHLKNSIRSTRILNNISFGKNSLDCTHIFRHLQATFFSDQGMDLTEISNKLGHTVNKTTLQYIHNNLVSNL